MSDTYMRNLSFENIAKASNGIYHGSTDEKDTLITGVAIDSRLVEPGFLFVPIKGERVDGHSFINQVFEKKAAIVLSEHELTEPAGPYIQVDSTTEALKKLAEFYRAGLDIKVVGITGSVGKTSTKEMVSSVLEQKYKVHKTAGNFNNEIGLPLTIFGIRDSHEVAVLEMGISDFGEMHRLATMAKPDIMIITNIGYCHLEFLGDRDGVLRAKTECFEHMMPGAQVVLNADDDKLFTKQMVNGKPVTFYGIKNISKSVGFYAENIKDCGFEGMDADIVTKNGKLEVHISIPGEHNIYNALAAAAAGMSLGLSNEQVKQGIESAETIAGRTNFIEADGVTIIDDCYNANPVSMKSAIKILSSATGRKIAVLGDMGELGKDEKQLHFEVGKAITENQITTLFCAGELSEEYISGVRSESGGVEAYHYQTVDEMIEELVAYVRKGDTVLVKASHFMGFTKVVDMLKSIAITS